MTATLEPISAFAGVNPALTSATASVATKLKVWLVDDNDRLRTLISELLGLEADIECARQFSSPDQLLSTLASRPGPDVILLDVQMGDRNGLDVVRPIKSLTPTTRVLMFTSCFIPNGAPAP
jgi:DNA-binding NarL/FixJ family response regulator